MKTFKQLLIKSNTQLDEARSFDFKSGKHTYTPDHKVGDEVGIIRHSQWGSSVHSQGHGKVVKTSDARGEIHVELHSHKDINGKPLKRVFTHDGSPKGDKYSMTRLVTKSEHDEHVKKTEDKMNHRKDVDEIHSIIAGHKTGAGDYVKFSKAHAARLHELIAKHIEK